MVRPQKKIIVGIVAAAVACVALHGANGAGLWFAHAMFDRVNPMAEQERVYAPVPAGDAYCEKYADASGGYDNYVYKLDALDGMGEGHTVYLISFGGRLQRQSSQREAAAWIAADAKGVFVARYDYVARTDVPEQARVACAGR